MAIPGGGSAERLFLVLLDSISFRDVMPLHLPMPGQPHTQTIARGLLLDPADDRTLPEWTAATGWSARTLESSFRHETGLTFGAGAHSCG